MHAQCTWPEEWKQQFTRTVLPIIETRSRRLLRLRGYRGERLQESLQEVRAIAWKRYYRSKTARDNPGPLVYYTTLQVIGGRKLVACRGSSLEGNGRARRIGRVTLADYASSCDSPPDAAAFRIDVPAWIQTLPPRSRAILAVIAFDLSRSGKDVARQFGFTAGRLSQIRRELREGLEDFLGE